MGTTKNIVGLLAVLGLSGCGSGMRVDPVAKFEGKEVCIIENSRVRASFLAAYRKTLEDKGYDVRVLPEAAQLSACAITSRYIASYDWRIVMYLSSADIRVYNKGKLAGRAFYAGNKHGEEESVKDLVSQLFPI